MTSVLEHEIPEACVIEAFSVWRVWQAELWEIVSFKQASSNLGSVRFSYVLLKTNTLLWYLPGRHLAPLPKDQFV